MQRSTRFESASSIPTRVKRPSARQFDSTYRTAIAMGPLGSRSPSMPMSHCRNRSQQRPGSSLPLASSFVGRSPSNLALDAIELADPSPAPVAPALALRP